MTLSQALHGIRHVGLDTSPFIYYIEGSSPWDPQVAAVFGDLRNGCRFATTSTVTLLEVLVQPLRLGRADLVRQYREALIDSESMAMVPVTAEIADTAARLRAAHNLRTPDAIQLATAIVAGCDAFITNDAHLKRVTEIPVLVLAELTA